MKKRKEKKMIEIDGGFGSGGGQIIRTAIAMSALTNKPCKIKNIRAKRKLPGLKHQHLTAVKAVAQLCDAKVKGAEIGSSELEFIPSKIKSGSYRFDIGTAGSITLVLQTLIPVALHSSNTVKFEITGGTNVPLAPSAEYFKNVFCDFLLKMGINISAEIIKHGFYPKGGGKMQVKIEPSKKLKPLYLEKRGEFIKISCLSKASLNLKEARVAERQIEGFVGQIVEISKKGNESKEFKIIPEIISKITKDITTYNIISNNIISKSFYVNSFSTGSAIHAYVQYKNYRIGSDSLGKKGLPSEKVGKKCANLLINEIQGNGVDSHAVDQLLPFIAIAGEGKILVNEITEHAKTNAFVIEKFLPIKFSINEKNKEIEVKKIRK